MSRLIRISCSPDGVIAFLALFLAVHDLRLPHVYSSLIFFNDLVLRNKGTWVSVFCHIGLIFWNELCNVPIHPHLNSIDDSHIRLIALVEISTIVTHCKTIFSKDPSIRAVRMLETENKAFQTGTKI